MMKKDLLSIAGCSREELVSFFRLADELKKKQILRLHCDDGRSIKLDGYKLRDFKSLVAFVDAHLPTGEAASDETPE